MNKTNKVAIVTGASQGIGAATAKLLALRGVRVVVNFVSNMERAQAVVSDIQNTGGEAISIQADVRNSEEVANMVHQIQGYWGSIDVLVCNAAMPFVKKSFNDITWEEFAQKLNDELKATFLISKEVLPIMVQQAAGHIIYVSSGLSKNPLAPGFIAHGTAKSALNSFAKYIAKEYGPNGIKVNVVAPGMVETERTVNQPKQFREHLASATPLQRVAKPEDVARVIAFYADDDSSFVTGVYTPVDGGLSMD